MRSRRGSSTACRWCSAGRQIGPASTTGLLNDDGRLYLTQTRVRGRYVIRFGIGQLYTARQHVQRAWQVIIETARGLEIAS